ncbi:uncharacterized protein [Miscanthus floridulus]|uniref:uncharacterized protein n=1 Tax=Miscanthus floridulus TaxID=154761 RepID=UPI0034577AC0
MSTALALARSLLPTAPLPAVECNLLVLEVQRSQVDHVENMERVDWDTIQIVETHDDECRIALISELQICELLGLTEDGTTNIRAQGFDCRMDEEGNDNEIGQDTDGAAIPTSDAVPGEMVISYDKNNPSMEVGTLYPTMEEFKLAVRQFAINKEFDLGVEKSCKNLAPYGGQLEKKSYGIVQEGSQEDKEY